jgi:hypothetical protein
MAIQQLGADGTSVLAVDATFKAARATLRPAEVIGWYSFGATSGLLTAVAAAGPVFSLRNTGSNLLMIRRVQVGFGVTTAFTAAQLLAYNLLFARSFTASDSGGTALYTAGMNKHRTGFTNITSAPDIRIATTAALTAGTRTLDTVPLGVAAGGATAVGVALSPVLLLSHDAGDYPVILAQNEGLVITNGVAMGAAGVINLHVNVEFAEVASY